MAAAEFVMPLDAEGKPDFGPVIVGPLAAWRAANPGALVANIGGRRDISDADFACLAGIRALDMNYCSQAGITDAAFAHLSGIHTLDMRWCDQDSITDAAFANLRGIHSLTIISCNQAGITDAAFAHLRGIHTLDMSHCSQTGITDGAFTHLRGIHTLSMSDCRQVSITDAAFAHLRGIHTLNMSSCSQAGITDAAFKHLRGINTLDMSGCKQAGITDAAFAHLSGIHTLSMGGCNQAGITDAAFAHLRGIHTLNMSFCSQAGITDAAFAHLRGIHTLNMSWCRQAGITDAAISHLRGIHTLDMSRCIQGCFTDASFAPLTASGIHILDISLCGTTNFTDAIYEQRPTLDLRGNDFVKALRIVADALNKDQQTFGAVAAALPFLKSALFMCYIDPTAEKPRLIEAKAPFRQRVSALLLGVLGITFSHIECPEASQFLTNFVVDLGEDWVHEIDQALTSTLKPAHLVLYAKDPSGRDAYHLSKPLCRAVFCKYLFLFGRYKLLPRDPREHASLACRVLFAQDRSPDRAPSEPYVVALKLMCHEAQFQREVGTRAAHGFSPEHVVGIARTHVLSSNVLLAPEAGAEAGARDFPHVVVLPAADKVCSTIIDSESQRSDWPEIARAITHAIAASLAHMHGKGLIHGDIKPRNIVRVDGGYALIDLDAAVRIGEPVSEKVSTAFAPPELLAAAAAAAPLAAHPSFDMWSLGVTLYLMLQKAPLFHSTNTDTLANVKEDGALLSVWSPEAHAAAVQRLSLSTEDRTARALVFDLLQRDPALRPSAEQVLQHPYLTRKPYSARLGGEAPAYDVFLSYRVVTEGRVDAKPKGGSGLVLQLYNALVAVGLRVFVDFVELKDGENWKEGFCAAAASSRVFVPLVSNAAIAGWGSLTAASAVDNVLLEHRLAIELRHRGYLSHIFPVFTEKCTPSLPNLCVDAIESVLVDQLPRAGLSLPLTPPQTVASIWRQTSDELLGVIIGDGDKAKQLEAIALRIHAICRPAAGAAADAQQPAGALSLQALQEQLVALKAALAQRKAAHAAALAQRDAEHAAALAAAQAALAQHDAARGAELQRRGDALASAEPGGGGGGWRLCIP